ncbi:hypothetical protein CAPTEDRAFT_193892 [Capitella teleta]|uniref:THAP-type domain-containing protein n=1 Tax=Capitella teleta TaxID=283909 RepID=R7V550_CAPTE|nr:hypothetical protein CAPTEDRAFT_193892 [Capitella teleta]|eukprot:ELU11486.1 hypothetical protein CAPTEDRAFT_193892 [Capitella teleta]
MPDTCTAYNCNNYRGKKDLPDGISYHAIYLYTKTELVKLLDLAQALYPLFFNFPNHLQKVVNPRTATPLEEVCRKKRKHPEEEPDNSPFNDHTYAITSVDDLKKKNSALQARVDDLERQLRNTSLRETKAKKNLRSALEDLKEKHLLTEDLQSRLAIFFDSLIFFSDLSMDVFNKPQDGYTDAQKEFALTLHMHGPKTYGFLQNDMKFHLPHPHMLQKWMRNVQAQPGLNASILDMLGKHVKQDPAKYGKVTLMIDAMALKKHVSFDPTTQRSIGYVNLGFGSSEEEVASEALVLMVVGLMGHWKAPIAYSSPEGDPDFLGIAATIEFIEIIDQLIDICNSRSPITKGAKASLSATNWNETKQFLLQARDFLLSLKNYEGVLLSKTRSFLTLIPALLATQSYVLTCKLSQDHLKLLFNAIRGAGGWNNNPTAVHFKSTFKQILVHCGVRPNDNGNVISLNSTTPTFSLDPACVCFIDNALVYIAGFVVRKVVKNLKCSICCASLVTEYSVHTRGHLTSSYHFLQLITVRVIIEAERCIRTSRRDRVELTVLDSFIRRAVGSADIFNLGSHISETQHGIENHHFELISPLVFFFHKPIRAEHVRHKRTSLLFTKRKRMRGALWLTFLLFQDEKHALNNTHFGENHTFASKKLRKSQFCLSYQYD